MKQAIVFLLLITFFFSFPAYSIRKDTKLILDQLQKLEAIVNNLDEKVTMIATETGSIDGRLKLVEEKVNAAARNLADAGQDKEKLLLSLQFIKEELNELKNSINKVNDSIQSLPRGGISTDGAAEGDSTQDTVTANQSPETTYYTAYSDYIKKNYPLAIEGFKQFIRLFPRNGLADNSLYWIGECYYSQKMYREAVSTFTQLITNYADGDKIPDAILKKGFALIEMGEQSQGIDVLKELISRFPLSEEASLGQQKINEVMD